MKNLMQKLCKTMVFEIILEKGVGEKSPFQACPILRFEFHLQNGNSFVTTVCAIGKYNKISPELFQKKFSYLRLVEIFAII